MIRLFLDDLREPGSAWDWVKSYDEFVQYMETHPVPDVISLDHDLADEHYPWNEPNPNGTKISYPSYREKTGYDCAKWLVEHQIFPKLLIIHTMNPVGADNILKTLEPHCTTVRRPYDPSAYCRI